MYRFEFTFNFGITTSPTGKYVSSINYFATSSQILLTVTYGGASSSLISGKTIGYSAVDSGSGVLTWTCATGTVKASYVPSTCY
jgi:hypothetical protein